MKHLIALAAIAAFAVATWAPTAAVAGGAKKRSSASSSGGGHRASRYYRRKPQVRGYRSRRRGGYSYSASDTINTYGDSRTIYGGANSYRFELYSRQSRSGPFDHGFFFDSGIGLHGGDSPYLN